MPPRGLLMTSQFIPSPLQRAKTINPNKKSSGDHVPTAWVTLFPLGDGGLPAPKSASRASPNWQHAWKTPDMGPGFFMCETNLLCMQQPVHMHLLVNRRCLISLQHADISVGVDFEMFVLVHAIGLSRIFSEGRICTAWDH